MDEFARTLLTWHDRNARDLPWRGERDPYRVWVSEMMLQQTRARTAIDYYARFLTAFPTVFALAEADESAVLKAWEGLGYYARARAMRAAARAVCDTYGGAFPQDEAALLALPGVGAYTADAVRSIAFGQRTCALDGNGVRVFSRVFAERGLSTRPDVRRSLKRRADELTPAERPGDFNQAVMGLGNLVCTPREPDCERCPVSGFCQAYFQGIASELPVKPPKPEKRVEARTVMLAFSPSGVLVGKRPARGLLAGLWEFPSAPGHLSPDALCAYLASLGVTARPAAPLPDARHVFTHLVWDMRGRAFSCSGAAPASGLRFVTLAELDALAMPTALRVYRACARETLTTLQTNTPMLQ